MFNGSPTEFFAVKNRSHNLSKPCSDTLIMVILPFPKGELEGIPSSIKPSALKANVPPSAEHLNLNQIVFR
jgi:hypothetical protein